MLSLALTDAMAAAPQARRVSRSVRRHRPLSHGLPALPLALALLQPLPHAHAATAAPGQTPLPSPAAGAPAAGGVRRDPVPPPPAPPSGAALLQGDDPLVIGPALPSPPVAGPRPADLGIPAAPAAAVAVPSAGGPILPASSPATPDALPTAPASPAGPLPPEAPPPRELVLERSRRLLKVVENGRVVRRFPVAVGMPGWETPVGRFTVLEMARYPVWEHPQSGTHTPPGPANPLGSRWIGFHRDCQGRRGWDGDQVLDLKGCVVAGFHGTPHRWTVGRAVSHGCVRLYDEDVKALYDLVGLGTVVTVLP